MAAKKNQQKKKEEVVPIVEEPETEEEEQVVVEQQEEIIVETNNDDEESSSEDEIPNLIDTNRLMESSSDDDDEDEVEEGEEVEEEGEEEEGESDEESEEEIDIEQVSEFEQDADVIPVQRLTINNQSALLQSLASIELGVDKLPFSEHMSVTSSEPVEIKDVENDLQRELAFYKQAIEGSKVGKTKLTSIGVPFARPEDYFAEMVKSDQHMDKLQSKIRKDEIEKKNASEARRQRDLKKFGKQVQIEKLQQRQKQKRDTLDNIKSLKRKGNLTIDDDFDIALEEAAANKQERRGNNDHRDGGKNSKRIKKDAKFGMGGQKRYAKANSSQSTSDLSGFNSKAMKQKRPGKSRRNANRR